jgi:small subunit ribosomal protein S20
MPNTKSAKKQLRKDAKLKVYNSTLKRKFKDLKKQSIKEIEVKDKKAKETVVKTIKALDKAVQKGVIKKNTCNRNKSKLQLKFNKAFATK